MTSSTESREIESIASQRLWRCGHVELKTIVCRHEPDTQTLILEGDVSLFYLKQLAQELVRGLNHVDHLQNLIVVRGE